MAIIIIIIIIIISDQQFCEMTGRIKGRQEEEKEKVIN